LYANEMIDYFSFREQETIKEMVT